METKPEEKQQTKEEVKKEVPSEKQDTSKPEVKPGKKVEEPKEEPKELSDDDKIKSKAEEFMKEGKERNETWVTLADENRDFWNSGDYLHFFVKKGRCKKLPEEISPVLENALSKENFLLREATEPELLQEMMVQAEEALIQEGEVKPRRFVEDGTPLKY